MNEHLAADAPVEDEPMEWEPEKRSRAHFVANITLAVAVIAITAMFLAYATWGRL